MEVVKLTPIEVEYCPVCSMPFEYCEYSKKSCAKKQEE